MRRPTLRPPSPATALSAAAGVALVASARLARAGDVGRPESAVFRAVNRAPESLRAPVWVVMQSGSLAAVFVTGAALGRMGRTHAAAVAAVAGTAVWGGVKLIKPLVGRERPADLLPDVRVRGLVQSGLGYPSGHAAVATTLACVVLTPVLPTGRLVPLGVGGLVGGTRIYVGAHLPLDVVGGIAIGVLGGCVAGSIPVRRP